MTITEEKLEQLCIDWFVEQGYQYKNGYDISPESETPERENYQQVVLIKRLKDKIALLNPELPNESINQVVSIVSVPNSPILIKSNKDFHKYLIEGVPFEYKMTIDDKPTVKHTHVRFIDFSCIENNDFLIVNQLTIKGKKGNRRPDIVVFINGLPIFVIELKNPADESTDIWSAYDQIQTYKNEISDLFIFNEALVVSDGWTARIGSLTANKERFLPWNTVSNEDDKPLVAFQLETIVKGFFNKTLLMDYMRYFILFENDNNSIIKKIAGYHQFHAVRAAVESTIKAKRKENEICSNHVVSVSHKIDKIKTGSGKAGVVWHTQGSGKSISMVCYASKLLQQPEMNNPTIVIVTDRNDLDNQLFNTFSMAKEVLKQTPEQADSRESLRNILSKRQSGGIVFTTIQKFKLDNEEEKHPILCERKNIVIISDEAHRSQYGNKAKLSETKDKEGNAISKYVFGYSKYLRDALPNASFIGFTGTPIAMDDKDTRGVFGEYISIYDIQDAVNDGATVPIYYESRLVRLDINQEKIVQLNNEVEEEIGEDEETKVREKIKSKWARLEKLVGTEQRIQELAKDLVEHFTTRTQQFPGKAMIVAMSREICVDLYNAIVSIKPAWHSDNTNEGVIKVVMTGSASDKEKLRPHIYNKDTKKLFEKRFKDNSDELKLAIVRDMWLTGFDAPCCHTMYIDKPMKGHNLMQAIARVNRVFKDKPGGLVVDYIGIANELKSALKTYTNSNGKGQPTIDITEAFAVLIEKIDIIRGMFATPVDGIVFNYRPEFEKNALKLLPGAVNHISGLSHIDSSNKEVRDGKRRFLDVMSALMKAFSLCNTMDEVNGYKNEIAFYLAIKTAFIKHASVDEKRINEERNSALKSILDNAIIPQGVDDIFSMIGMDKPNISLLSEEFLEDFKNVKEKNLAVELLEKLLKDEIKSTLKNDIVQEKKYSERIMDTLRKYHNRSIETSQVIEELIQMAKEMQNDAKMTESLNLSEDEIVFYRALVRDEKSVKELGDDNLRQLAIELTNQLKKSTTVDWHKKESVRATMRISIRRLLTRWKYPPDKSKEATELVLKQAEVLADSWDNTY